MKLPRFDTRDTKPKLRALLILTLTALLAVVVLLLAWGERCAAAVCFVLAAYALGAILALLWAFREQIRYNPYSYNTIFYFGFALFGVSVFVTCLVLGFRMLTEPEVYTPNQLLHSLLDSAKTYMLISSPFLLVFSIGLCISNVSLIRHEGRRVVNLLGILLSFLIVGGMVFLFAFDYYVSGSRREVMLHDLITNLFAAIYLYFECMLLGIIVADVIAARYEPEKDKDFLIVLGCGLRKDGTPTNLLRGRLDRALAFAARQKRGEGADLRYLRRTGSGRGHFGERFHEAVSDRARRAGGTDHRRGPLHRYL